MRWRTTVNLRWSSVQQLAMAKQQLGCLRRIVRERAVKLLALRAMSGAICTLYSSASGNVNAPALQMQLMLVQTGEIIWSGKGAVQQQ